MATATATRKPAAKKASARPTRDLCQEITDQVIEMMEAGTAPWHQSWSVGAGDASMPRSMSTGKVYRGINPMMLSMQSAIHGYTSPWWGTYRQIMGRLGVTDETPADDERRSALKGQKGTLVVFWKPFPVQDKATGEKKMAFVLKHFVVFNACQVAEGLDLKLAELPEVPENEAIDECEQAIARYLADGGPAARFGGDRACYSPAADTVYMPVLGDFEGSEEYYGTYFHELVHSTGHASRLNRKGITELGPNHYFGSESYAEEELVAEMGAAFLSGMTGVGAKTLPNSAAYLANWIQVLKNDKKILVKAAGKAQKAAELILGNAPVYTSDED